MTSEEFEKRKKEQGLRASAKYNGDFFCITTYSGHLMLGQDSDGSQHLLPPNADPEVLGNAVLDSLSKSRFLTLQEADVFFDNELGRQRYVSWVQNLIDRYNYKAKTALFRRMLSVNIKQSQGKIVFSPSHHERGGAWSGVGFTEEDNVIISETASSEEIGAALKLAFSRCTGAGALEYHRMFGDLDSK